MVFCKLVASEEATAAIQHVLATTNHPAHRQTRSSRSCCGSRPAAEARGTSFSARACRIAQAPLTRVSDGSKPENLSLTHVACVGCRAVGGLRADEHRVTHDLCHDCILPRSAAKSGTRARIAHTSRLVSPPPSPPAIPWKSPPLSHKFHKPSFLALALSVSSTGGTTCHLCAPCSGICAWNSCSAGRTSC